MVYSISYSYTTTKGMNMRPISILLVLIIAVCSGCGTLIQPMPPQAAVMDGQFMVRQAVNIPFGKGSFSTATTDTHTALEEGILVPKEGGHFSRNWGKYLSGAVVSVIAGDYLSDREWDAYGIIGSRGSDSHSHFDCGSDRKGEVFRAKERNRNILRWYIHQLPRLTSTIS